MKRPLRALPLLLLFVTAGSAAAEDRGEVEVSRSGLVPVGPPTELQMKRAGSTTMDLRDLSQAPPRKRDRPEREAPQVERAALPGGSRQAAAPTGPGPTPPAPSPLSSFLGLDFANWGAGRPPDTVGDVGPTYYIQAVSASIGIYRKSDSAQVAAFTFDTLMSQGNFGNPCDTHNSGDPIVLYDSFEDRWVITDVAFRTDPSVGVLNPPGAFQCFAVSMTGDPVAGGWHFYSLNVTDGVNLEPKLGIWPDGIYMSANMFSFRAGGPFQGPRVWAFNKAQMYAGEPTVNIVSFNPPPGEFSLLPANARLPVGTPPPGTPNYFTVVWQFTYAVSIYKFHVDWERPSLSTFTGPNLSMAPCCWLNPPVTAPARGGNNNDTIVARLMMQNQYTNLGGVESLWNSHTIGHPTAAGVAAVRWYQSTVTGGTVAANAAQAATHTPDTTIHRYLPSLAVDRAGNMSLGYSASSATLFPAIRYAGRLATDPLNTLPQTETSLIEGTGSQNVTNLWGTYSAMSIDPDGCRFWYTNEYYITTGDNWQTRIGSFAYPSCTPAINGTVQGTVAATVGGAPISGATVALGSRTETTNGSGFYQFLNVPSGTYPSLAASAPGYDSSSFSSVVVTDGATTTRDFTLDTAPASGCLLDASPADFQTGVSTNVDLTAGAGDVILLSPSNLDQQNDTQSTAAVGITTTAWGGQTFTAGLTGQLTKVEINLFCVWCLGSFPNLTLSLRATSGNLPTGPDIASATIPGFNSAAGRYFTATFSSPPTVTAGTVYALVIRPVANPAGSTYALTRGTTNEYASGQLVTSANGGATWTAPLVAGETIDAAFKTYVRTGFTASGNFVGSLKDANPAVGFTTNWSTLSWTATTPANTALRFQVAGSNSAVGPFDFVGPDGTAATFFTASGASLGQFNGNRYLKYKAYLSTTDNAVTPTLHDVSVCYTDTALAPVDLSIAKSDGGASVAPGGTVAYTLTYANTGSIGATGVVITETVPTHTTFNLGASARGWFCAPNDGAGSTCTLGVGSLATATGDQTTFAVTVDNPLAGSVAEIDNTATIGDDGANGADRTPGTNSASDTTPVRDGLYYIVPQCRLVDTRNAAGPYGGPALNALSTDTFVAAGQCGVPAGAKALSFNITVTQGTEAGDLRVYPAGMAPPVVSVINYAAGQTRANIGVVLLGAAGDFVVQSDQPTGTVHVIIDVNGYFR